MGAHNAAFLRDASSSFSLAGNQFHNATVALSAGIRLLQAQVHLHNDVLTLCHTACSLLSAGPLQNWLSAIKTWLDSHPNDVVTLVLVNSATAPVDKFGGVFAASGLSSYGYVPEQAIDVLAEAEGNGTTTTTTWPSLREMIDANKRLVVFLTNISPSPAHPYLLDEFQHIFETAYEVTSPNDFSCTIDRPSSVSGGSVSDAVGRGMMGCLNHFAYSSVTDGISVPNLGAIETVNSGWKGGNGTEGGEGERKERGGLGWHMDLCVQGEWNGKRPNFVLVDFWDKGDVLDVGDRLNGVEGATVGRERVVEGEVESGAVARWESKLGGMVALVGFVVGGLLVV
jgi:hypothetical protein